MTRTRIHFTTYPCPPTPPAASKPPTVWILRRLAALGAVLANQTHNSDKRNTTIAVIQPNPAGAQRKHPHLKATRILNKVSIILNPDIVFFVA